MKSLNESSNYIELNTGCKYSSKILDSKLKNKIENFVNEFTKISPEINNYGFLSNFKNKFMEKYGNNVEVDLIEIIDENKFNGLAYLNDSFNANDREKDIIKIIKNKIEIAIFNDKEVYLVKGDFKNIDNSKLNLTKGFGLNLYITKSKGAYDLIVGTNGRAPKEGSMFQRFSDSFVKEDFVLDLNIVKNETNKSGIPSIAITCIPCVLSQWKCPSLKNPNCSEGRPQPTDSTLCQTISPTDMGMCDNLKANNNETGNIETLIC